jgi:membrane fusion protein, heavy metal efflux system
MSISKAQLVAIVLILGIGAVLGGLVLRSGNKSPKDEHGHAAEANDKGHTDHKGHSDDETAPRKGPHGGKLFTSKGFGLEISIFETGVEPRFRIYTYLNGKPIPPVASKVSVTLQRLGAKPQEITFTPEQDYLKGNVVVEEPHSFAVQVFAQHNGVPNIFTYEQIEGRVNLSDEQAKSNGVGVAVAGPARIQSTLQLTGEVGLNQDRTVQVVPRLTGRVETVKVGVGERVRKGQLMAVVSSQLLADQRGELMAASKRLTMARSTFDREKKLWEEKISAKQDYLQAQQALQEAEIAVQLAREKLGSLGALASTPGKLTNFEIRAPIDGMVTTKKISVGEVLKDDVNIFTVADLSTVWVELNIYAKDLNTVKVGQKATVKATGFEASAQGAVSYVGALIGNQTRTAAARIVLSNAKGIWHPGLPVNVELVAAEVEVPVAISVDAVQTFRDAPAVFGRYGDSFEARPVQLGRSDGKMVEVTKGLNAGEKYASDNSYLIKADIGKSSANHDH